VKKVERKFWIGIDLGWREKKTTGICVLDYNPPSTLPAKGWAPNKKIVLSKDVFGRDVLKVINSYLKDTKVIAIDAPLTKGRGKGKVNPLPPALMPKLCETAKEVVEKLEKKGFVLGINLIETFPTLVKKICKAGSFSMNAACQTENQKSALICAQLAFLHSQFKTRWLGYKDGFLFLPEMSFWKKDWKEKFYQAWKSRPYLKYRRLITNLWK